MKVSIATLTLVGIAPMTQSHKHNLPMLEGESHDAYDKRTWRGKLNLSADSASVIIPAHGMHQCIAAAAKYSKRKIQGQGNSTWSKKFEAGIMLAGEPALGVHPDVVQPIDIYVNADGVRGSGKRVMRRFPQIGSGWRTTFDIFILDPIITEEIFREMVEMAGIFIGVGQFRPEKLGTNGRFKIGALVWQDNREFVPK